jgi:hypothetical protein
LPQETAAPTGWQEPAPSQRRSWAERASALQAGLQLPSGSDMPAGMGVQVPTEPASAQLWQAPQATLQQTPSAQVPLAHSEPWVQGAPGFFFPHWFIRQGEPAAHWAASEHELKQSAAAGLHW